MATLTIEAFGLGPLFEQDIAAEFGVYVKDSTGAPWQVVFQGPRDQLVAMWAKHWSNSEPGETFPESCLSDD